MNLDNVVQFPGFHSAERDYAKSLYKKTTVNERAVDSVVVVVKPTPCGLKNTIVQEIEKAREQIKTTLLATAPTTVFHENLKLEDMERNQKEILETIKKINSRLDKIETVLRIGETKEVKSEPNNDDDDIDLFGSEDEDEDEEKERVKEERVRAYNEKKASKPVLVAKSNIILDVKPWDDETDMGELERCVRSVEADGLLWGSSKLVPLAYGIKKLQISCVVEDDKVGTDFLEEKITAFGDLVQSVDIAAFNKI